MTERIFRLSRKKLNEKIKTLPVPPGEEEKAFYQRVEEQLGKLWRLQVFENIDEALDIAANWARETPQTEQEIRQGVLDERKAREKITERRMKEGL